MDRMRFAGITSREITVDTGLVNEVEAELPRTPHLHEGAYFGAMGMASTADDTALDLDLFPFKTADTGNNTAVLSNVVGEARNFNSGSPYKAKLTKAGAANYLSVGAFAVR